MRNPIPSFQEALGLVNRVDAKYRPAWNGRSPEEQAAMASYFLPHGSRKLVLAPTRPQAVKWYCPFASQDEFPTGHRYCINVYAGCPFDCEYCYAVYSPDHACSKADFRKKLDRDLNDLEQFDVAPAPVHLSNSTDAFQPMEKELGDTRYALEGILAHRSRFSRVTMLTKNPLLPVQLGYVDLFKALMHLPAGHKRADQFKRSGMPGFVMEVSLAFRRQETAKHYDRCAPSVDNRIEGIRALHEAGIPLVLRIDPLFPCSPLMTDPPTSPSDFGSPEAQTLDDLEQLVLLAKDVGAMQVVYSSAKICLPRGRGLSDTMCAMKRVYEALAAPQKLDFRGGSWRLPRSVAETHVVRPFLDICRRHGVLAKHCKQDLLETP